jgi:hypothetical protein
MTPSRWFDKSGWRIRFASWLIGLGCRHPDGAICEHNHWRYDVWLDGYGEGQRSATLHVEAEQRGDPPYADHPCLRCGRLDCNDINAIITLLYRSEEAG